MENWYKTAIADLNENIDKINPDLIPTYCMQCKKHLRGVKAGYDHPTASHGLCEECSKIIMKILEEGGEISEEAVNQRR